MENDKKAVMIQNLPTVNSSWDWYESMPCAVIRDVTQAEYTFGYNARVANIIGEDIKARAEEGKIKYGTYLYAENSRDALIDAYQEALDLAQYLKQVITENEMNDKARVVKRYNNIIDLLFELREEIEAKARD